MTESKLYVIIIFTFRMDYILQIKKNSASYTCATNYSER
jgi:hypothetical protein